MQYGCLSTVWSLGIRFEPVLGGLDTLRIGLFEAYLCSKSGHLSGNHIPDWLHLAYWVPTQGWGMGMARGAKLFKAMPLYSSMTMRRDMQICWCDHLVL